jgi:hypothetical protein
MRIAALEQERSVIKTPEGDNRDDVASRHKYYNVHPALARNTHHRDEIQTSAFILS